MEYLNKKEINADALTDFNFNDALLNESYTNLPYAFQFKNFYVSKNAIFIALENNLVILELISMKIINIILPIILTYRSIKKINNDIFVFIITINIF